jgi:hypothetical protein
MKNLLSVLILFLCLKSQSQVVTGLYSGTLFNDTTKMLQKYEVALSEYRGKITGYSYTTFVSKDTFYYGIRSVTATRKDGNLIIEDDKLIANNFPEISRKVRRISTIPLKDIATDTITTLKGRWQTTQTKHFYSVPGSIDLKRDADSSQSALIGHLRELKILGASYAVTRTDAVAETKNATSKKPEATPTVATKAPTNTTPAATNKNVSSVLPYTQRAEKVLQEVPVAADSLTLSFYDNGVVDGDVISVYVNGENVIDNAKLTGAAIKKTIALKASAGEIKILLVAETLGSLPPNTGLLIIDDGTNSHNVHFSADLQTNASIILRRNK